MPGSTKASVELWNVFQAHTRSYTKRIAISTSKGEMTFAELFTNAENMAVALARAGVQEGSLVALALPNSLAFVPCFLALCKLSATVALVSPKYGASELQAITDGVHPRAFLTTAALAKELTQKIGSRKPEVVVTMQLSEALELVFPASPSDISTKSLSFADTALIKFTSGSTGEPKGIALTAGNVLVEAQNVVATLALTPDDRILAVVPIFHSYGFDLGVLAMLASGAMLILRDSFVPRRLLADLSEKGVTVFLGVPSMYRFLVEINSSSLPKLSHLRYLLSCTAPLQPDLITEFYQKYRMPICQHYGSSETGAVTTHVPAEVLQRSASVGLPMRNVEVRILDQNGEEMAAGMEGEVVVRSAAIARGYVMGRPSQENLPFKDGAYWTGDSGVIDEDGFLYLRGRKDAVINVGGLKVSPYEVTQVLESLPAVREAAVLGVKDAMGEKVVYAAVTLHGTMTEQEILAFCRTRLADYKVPRRIDILEEMPRGPSGKIKLRPEDVQL